MTADEQNSRSRELAERDLKDIQALRDSEAFRRYFLRRLKDRMDRLNAAFRYDPLSHEDREVHRRLVNEYDELLKLLDQDEAACRSTLGHG
jgi:hypothetical protein